MLIVAISDDNSVKILFGVPLKFFFASTFKLYWDSIKFTRMHKKKAFAYDSRDADEGAMH